MNETDTGAGTGTAEQTPENPATQISPVEATPRYAGFSIRAVAHMIDEVLLLIASMILTYITLFAVYFIGKSFQVMAPTTFGEAFSGGMIQIVNIIASLALSVPYYVAFTHLRGATLGKELMGIRVVDEVSGEYPALPQAFGRLVSSILSAALFGAGYIVAAFNPKKKALHDSLAGTVCIRR